MKKTFDSMSMKILRLALGKTQIEMAELLGCSRSFYAKLELGNKTIPLEKQPILNELEVEYEKSQNISIENLECLKSRKELGEEISIEENNSMYSDIMKLKDEFTREQKALIYTITKTRKAQQFVPSINASIDKISLVVDLTLKEAKDFYDEFIATVGADPRVEYSKRVPSLKDYENLFVFHETDGKIVVKFVTLDKTGKRVNRILMEYNPNKVKLNNEFFEKLTKFFPPNRIKVRKLDICKDYVGVSNKDIITFEAGGKPTQTLESKYASKTLYFGDMNSNGVRVYDKRGELLEVDKKNIDYECTRYELRLTLRKYIPLESLNTEIPKLNLPILGALNKGVTEAFLDTELLVEDMYLIRGLYKGDISLSELSIENKEKYKNVFDAIKVETLHLESIEIIDAVIKFYKEYDFTYAVNHLKAQNVSLEGQK